MHIKPVLILIALIILTPQIARAEAFDHSVWNSLLRSHVIVISQGKETAVDYDGMAEEQAKLKVYLASLAKVQQPQFDSWPANEQLAFLINAYNAWTVELILTAWPNIESIKDLGGFFRSPWRKKFIPLLGKTRSLDDIEHKLIRGSGRYRDPRIHFAVNCASIGCPPLRPEAYTGARLSHQLEEQTELFLSDKNRNHLQGDELMLSPIFKWYREDFEKGWLGFNSLESFLLAHAQALDLPPGALRQLRASDLEIGFLDYDWGLNAKR